MSKRTALKLDNLDRAYNKLRLFLTVPHPSELEQTGIIKAFEYTFDLFWQTLKTQGEMDGLVLPSPRTALSYAWQAGFLTSHSYSAAATHTRRNTACPSAPACWTRACGAAS